MDAQRRDAALIDQVTAVLTDGPCPLEDLTELLAEGGYLDHWPADDFPDLVDQLDDFFDRYDGLWITPGDIVALSGGLLVDTVFTHRVSKSELDREMLDASPDLDPLGCDVDELLLVAGGTIELVFPETDPGAHEAGSYAGPPGWLAGFAADDLVAVHRGDDGVRIEVIGQTGAGELEIDALQRAFAARARPASKSASRPSCWCSTSSPSSPLPSRNRCARSASCCTRRGSKFGASGSAPAAWRGSSPPLPPPTPSGCCSRSATSSTSVASTCSTR